jgi:hypothetical protein
LHQQQADDDENLNLNWLLSLDDAQQKIEAWWVGQDD